MVCPKFFVLMYKAAKRGGKAGASLSCSYLPPFSLIFRRSRLLCRV